MSVHELTPEARTLLLDIAQRHAFRHHAAVNLRGHGLQFLDEVHELREFTREIDFQLGLLEGIEGTYRELGGDSLAEAVQVPMERVPYPESRLELACCLVLLQRGQRAAARAYVECAHPGFAAVSQAILEHELPPNEEDVLARFCQSEDHRASAQGYWTRWLQLCLGSVGRLGAPADQQTVDLGLRTLSVADMVRTFLDDLEPVREACGLKHPSLTDLGIELPEDLRGRFPSA